MIERYIDGKEGRMIWSPKNALGTDLDRNAQTAILGILNNRGFKNIEFDYEPIAASAYYEQSVLSDRSLSSSTWAAERQILRLRN